MTTNNLRWAICFSGDDDSPAHLIGSEWLTRRLCTPKIVNSQLAEPARGRPHCLTCELLLAGHTA